MPPVANIPTTLSASDPIHNAYHAYQPYNLTHPILANHPPVIQVRFHCATEQLFQLYWLVRSMLANQGRFNSYDVIFFELLFFDVTIVEIGQIKKYCFRHMIYGGL